MTERYAFLTETGCTLWQQHSGRPAPGLRHRSGKRDNDDRSPVLSLIKSVVRDHNDRTSALLLGSRNEERDRPSKLRPVSLFGSLLEQVIGRGGLEIRIDVGLGPRVLSCVIGERLVKILSIA